MDVNLKLGSMPTTEVSVPEFFNHLSKKDGIVYGYGFDNTQFTVTRNNHAINGELWKIEETVLGWKFNPLRFFVRPETGENKAHATANLAALIKDKKTSIVQLPEVDVERVIAAFERIRDKMVRNTNDYDKQRIVNNFNEASALLRNEAIKQGIDGYATNFKSRNFVKTGQFFNDLTHTWWPLKFDKQFQVVDFKNSGRYQIHYQTKPPFFQKWVKWPTEITSLKFWRDMKPNHIPGPAKVATAEKLAELVIRNHELIREMRPDTGAMIANLEQIKGRIIRNTNPQEKARIKAGFNKAIAELMKVGVHVKRDRNNSWSRWIWNHTAAPMGNIALEGPKLALRLTWAGVKAFSQLFFKEAN